VKLVYIAGAAAVAALLWVYWPRKGENVVLQFDASGNRTYVSLADATREWLGHVAAPSSSMPSSPYATPPFNPYEGLRADGTYAPGYEWKYTT
jgi:hypothetical protein